MGNRWGAGKGNGEGGGQFTSNLGPEWTGITPHAKEGFQVRGTWEQGRDSPGRGGITKGDRQGVIKGTVPCA